MSTTAGTLANTRPDSVAPYGVELVVDLGTVTSRAMVCWPDGRRSPLITGGGSHWPPGPHWPSGVFAARSGLVAGPDAVTAAQSNPESFCRDLKSVLTHEQVTLGDHSMEPVAGLAALLALLADQAQQLAAAPVTSLTLTTPAGWGPRHRTALRAAAQRAELPEPQLVPVPIAAACLLTTSGHADLPLGALLLVCDFGHAAFEASLLARTPTGFFIQSTARTPAAGGHAVEALLAEHCLAQLATADPDLADRLRTPTTTTDHHDRAALDTTIHLAARRLATGQDASILVPSPCPPVSITAEQYTEMIAPIASLCADTATGVVQAADLHPTQLTCAYEIGGASTDTALDALAQRGLEPTPIPHPELAALAGAAATPTTGDQHPPAAPRLAGRFEPRGAVGTIVAGSCSLALIVFALYSSAPNDSMGYGPLPDVNWGEYAMAATCAMLATTAAAQTPTRPPSSRKIPGRVRIPRLVRAVIAGLVVALAYAAAGTRSLMLPWSAGTYLRWALFPVLAIAACATLVGLLYARYPRHATRAESSPRYRWFPVEATATATLGMILIQLPLLSDSGHYWQWNTLLAWFPTDATTAQDILGHTGAILIGAGTALAATTSSRWRILTVPVAAAIAGTVPQFDLTSQLGVAFVTAATLWWAVRAGRLAIATAPHWRPHLPTTLRPTTPRVAAAIPAQSPYPPSNDGHDRSRTKPGSNGPGNHTPGLPRNRV